VTTDQTNYDAVCLSLAQICYQLCWITWSGKRSSNNVQQ